jgi:hypothetical protein
LIEVKVGAMSNVWPLIRRAGGVYPLLLDRGDSSNRINDPIT